MGFHAAKIPCRFRHLLSILAGVGAAELRNDIRVPRTYGQEDIDEQPAGPWGVTTSLFAIGVGGGGGNCCWVQFGAGSATDGESASGGSASCIGGCQSACGG